VFQLAIPVNARRLALAVMVGAMLLCGGMGGAAWYVTRCTMLDYLNRATASPLNPREQYLFACGAMWRSADGGRLWRQQPVRGLPLGARDGRIAADRRPGLLYLGLLINSRSTRYCLDCAWTKLQPVIYTSKDGGQTWAVAYTFKRGPADNGGFLALFTDPDREGTAWAVVKNADEIAYYVTGTAGRFWRRTCIEYLFPGSGSCDVPDNVLQFNQPSHGSAVGQ
jgi:hypothetical protein